MAKLTLTHEQALAKRLRLFQILSGILLITIISGLLLYYLYRPQPFNMSEIGEKILGEVPPEIAQKNLAIYRQRGAYASLSLYPGIKVRGVLHDTADMQSYINDKFKLFTSTHIPKEHCVWQIGIYPMVCKETRDNPNKPRIGFYLIPTMVDTTAVSPEKGVLDYFELIKTEEGRKYYEESLASGKKTFTGKGYIFDEGHLWP